MDQMHRFALYYAPPPGPLADFAADWLGWDATAGREMPHPIVPGLPGPVEELTRAPRKYGLHGTLKPPFRLAQGATP
ncbi:MAG: phosphonate metabolism protein, partial [Alphaproteobacteria bacterium HGW-Alphaproteobacteria-8]